MSFSKKENPQPQLEIVGATNDFCCVYIIGLTPGKPYTVQTVAVLDDGTEIIVATDDMTPPRDKCDFVVHYRRETRMLRITLNGEGEYTPVSFLYRKVPGCESEWQPVMRSHYMPQGMPKRFWIKAICLIAAVVISTVLAILFWHLSGAAESQEAVRIWKTACQFCAVAAVVVLLCGSDYMLREARNPWR